MLTSRQTEKCYTAGMEGFWHTSEGEKLPEIDTGLQIVPEIDRTPNEPKPVPVPPGMTIEEWIDSEKAPDGNEVPKTPDGHTIH